MKDSRDIYQKTLQIPERDLDEPDFKSYPFGVNRLIWSYWIILKYNEGTTVNSLKPNSI